MSALKAVSRVAVVGTGVIGASWTSLLRAAGTRLDPRERLRHVPGLGLHSHSGTAATAEPPLRAAPVPLVISHTPP